MTRFNILVVDDEELIRWSLRSSLEKAGYLVFEAESGKAALDIVQRNEVNLVILDIVLQDQSGLDVLRKMKEFDDRIEVIMMTAFGSITSAVEAMKSGALDYLSKPFNLDEVVLKVEKAWKEVGRIRELRRLKKNFDNQFISNQMVYKSSVMKKIMRDIEKICKADVDVILLTGETGVGKGLLAKTIHNLGSRSEGPFVTLNCTAIPETLMESELFGYEKGAFTDAKGRKEGVVEQAIGGTLFFDEIGDMPFKLQGKLLRFIEEKRFRRIGGNNEIQVNVRLISATNKNLREAMQNGEFRPDLFHRLNLIHIHIPPLRERKEDILPLANYFLDKYNLKYGKKIEKFTKNAQEILLEYSWPGNVRELSNVIERFCILENTQQISRSCISAHLLKSPNDLPEWRGRDMNFHGDNVSFETLLKDFKRHVLEKALHDCNFNKTKAAELLKMDRSTFKYQLKMVGLEK